MLNTTHAAPETNKFVKVFVDEDRTEEFNVEQQNAVHNAPPAIKYIEDDHS